MSESLSWMQTGDTLALSGELDQDVFCYRFGKCVRKR